MWMNTSPDEFPLAGDGTRALRSMWMNTSPDEFPLAGDGRRNPPRLGYSGIFSSVSPQESRETTAIIEKKDFLIFIIINTPS
jgi:hypothetical protein